MAPKVVRKVIPAPRPHWGESGMPRTTLWQCVHCDKRMRLAVGNGFHVFPVFGELAFSEELSPWLMFDYAAPKVFEPSKSRRGVGQVCLQALVTPRT